MSRVPSSAEGEMSCVCERALSRRLLKLWAELRVRKGPMLLAETEGRKTCSGMSVSIVYTFVHRRSLRVGVAKFGLGPRMSLLLELVGVVHMFSAMRIVAKRVFEREIQSLER